MVYIMKIYIDGGCRGNGNSWAKGAAAVAVKRRNGTYIGWYRTLPSSPTPTNQRAELTAVIMALKKVLERYEFLNQGPYMDVTIYSDSRYVVDCMTKWVYKWSANGWVNAKGDEVANQDLIREASRLDDEVGEIGDVSYVHIPRANNRYADNLCKECLDQQG
ncbi:ribonuclease H-like domain-containing protein [Aspergillus heterothallicus]